MRKYIVISLGILVLGVCSCRRGTVNPEEERFRMREDVAFAASASPYLTKASDTAVEDGDAIGIFALDPIDVMNVKGEVKAGAVTPQIPVKWELDQKVATRFAAYMPYTDESVTLDNLFYVQPDQSTAERYFQSDLRYAVTDALPGCKVEFLFQHALSKLIVEMGNGQAIRSVITGDLALNARLNMVDGSLEPGSFRGSVTLGKAVAKNGGKGFVAILVPQSGNFPLNVILESGQAIQATLDASVTIEPGVAYIATVGPVSGNEARFSLSITDWGDGGEMSYGKPKQQ